MRRSKAIGLGLVLWVTMLSAFQAAAGPAVALSLAVQPGSVRTGDEVVYTITATNAGDQDVRGLSVSQSLPPGFIYCPGSTVVSVNGTRIGGVEPVVAGRSLTWGNLSLPAARSTSVYGMHTMVQDRCDNGYIDYQLDRVREVAGPGAYVKQLFYWITPETPGPQGCWSHFVYAAYERGLIPVIRLQGLHGGPYWLKPQPDRPADYTSIAQAFKRVVAGLPRRDNLPLYVEVWNEPNLAIEWSGAPNPVEYAEFLVDVAAALRSLNDPRIVILNGALSPGGEYDRFAFIDAMATVPGALQAFDVWAAHPYPGNHPPEYNIHDRTATYRELTIDSYLLELDRLAAHGRSGLRVLLTETGYALGAADFMFEGYPQITEENRADYIARALRDYWSRWPEVLGVCPYELVDPSGSWWVWDWLYPDGRHHWQYDSVAGIDKRPAPAASRLTITFRAVAGASAGTYTSDLTAVAGGVTLASAQGLAPVTVAFATPTPSRTPFTPTPGPSPTPVPTSCREALRNGGFEADTTDWSPMGAVPAGFSTAEAHSGARSLRLGLDGASNVYAYSSAEQALTPLSVGGVATLSLWYKVVSANPAGDRAYILLADAGGRYRTLGNLDLGVQGWTYVAFPVPVAWGEIVAVRLTAVNDGAGAPTAVYVDDVSWLVCSDESVPPTPAPTATPSPTPTATPTATPTPTFSLPGCRELLGDGGFEEGTAWKIWDTPYPAGYVSSPIRSGQRALRLGIGAAPDVASYSSAEQTVVIPADATAVRLSFWVYRVTTDSQGDVQYVLALDEGGGYQALMWELVNAPAWQRREFALDGVRGQRVTLRFGVRNDGDGALTAMYVDDVSLTVCNGGTPTPEPTATKAPLPTPVAHAHVLHLPVIGRAAESSAVGAALARGIPGDKGAVASPGHYRALAADPESGQVFAVTADGLWALAADNLAPVRRLLAGRDLRAIHMDLNARQLLVSDWGEGAVVALDPAGAERARSPRLLRPSGLAVYGGQIFVAETGADQVVVLDRRTCGIMETVPVGQAPYTLAVDAKRGRVWVASAGGDSVTVLDAQTGMPVGTVHLAGLGHPQGLAVDGKRGRAYVTFLHSPLLHGLAVIRADDLRVERVLHGDRAQPLLGAYGVAVEPGTGRIFLSDVQGLLALDPDTLRPALVRSGHGFALPFGLQVEPASGRLLTADSRGPALRALNMIDGADQ